MKPPSLALVVALLAATLAGPGCGSTPSAPQGGAPAAGSTEPSPPAGWEGQPVGSFHSQRFDLDLALPDGKSWRIDDHASSWLHAVHGPSESALWLRLFRSEAAMNRARCEAAGRDAEPSLPTEQTGKLVEARDQDILPGWDARALSVIVPRRPAGLSLDGHLVVFAARIRQCLVVHYATHHEGRGSEGVVGGRLGDISALLRTIRFGDERLGPPREPPPGSGAP